MDHIVRNKDSFFLCFVGWIFLIHQDDVLFINCVLIWWIEKSTDSFDFPKEAKREHIIFIDHLHLNLSRSLLLRETMNTYSAWMTISIRPDVSGSNMQNIEHYRERVSFSAWKQTYKRILSMFFQTKLSISVI